MGHSFRSNCPVVKTEQAQLCQLVQVGNGRQAVPFTAQLQYLRESRAQLNFMHGGKVVKEGSSYSDYYGYLSSIDGALEEAQNLCAGYAITTDSSLSLTITVHIEDRIVTSDEPPNVEYGRTLYRPVDSNWLYHIPERVAAWQAETDAERRYELGKGLWVPERVDVFKAEVWSSKFPDRIADIKVWVREQGF